MTIQRNKRDLGRWSLSNQAESRSYIEAESPQGLARFRLNLRPFLAKPFLYLSLFFCADQINNAKRNKTPKWSLDSSVTDPADVSTRRGYRVRCFWPWQTNYGGIFGLLGQKPRPPTFVLGERTHTRTHTIARKSGHARLHALSFFSSFSPQETEARRSRDTSGLMLSSRHFVSRFLLSFNGFALLYVLFFYAHYSQFDFFSSTTN